MKYRKIPVVIDAIQYDGDNVDEILEFCDGKARMEDGAMIIETLEDNKEKATRHEASKGDFIIRGIEGEFYFCKPEIFEKTYEKVNEDEDDEEIKESISLVESANK